MCECCTEKQTAGVGNTDASSPLAINDVSKQRRALRLRRRRQYARWVARAAIERDGVPDESGKYEKRVHLPRAYYCGHAGIAGRGVGGVGIMEDGTQKRLISCGNVWTCPVCSARILAGRGEEIAEAVRRHEANGGGCLLLTETLSHTKHDSLAELMETLKLTHKYTWNSRIMKELRKTLGIVGYITALEVTRGENGWHPHQHVLVLTKMEATEHIATSFKRIFWSSWHHQIERLGAVSSYEHGLDVLAVENGKAGAMYVSKIGCEMSGLDNKEGKGSITPFQLLDEQTSDYKLWSEYVDATRGKSRIRWSRGLRAALGMAPAPTDQQLAEAEEHEEHGEELATISSSLFNEKMLNNPEVTEQVVNAVLSGEFKQIARILDCSYYILTAGGRQRFVFVEKVAGKSERLLL